MDATKYRPVEETYPYLDVTFSNDQLGAISAFEVAAYAHNGNGGTKITLRGSSGTHQLQDAFADFEKRLFECIAVEVLGDVDEPPKAPTDQPKTDEEPKQPQQPKKK